MPTEHRRIAFTGGAIVTADPAWNVLRSSPAFGTDLEAGEIVALAPSFSSLTYYFEIADGALDADPFTSPTPSTVTLDVQVITITRDRGEDSYQFGIPILALACQSRAIELDLPPQGLSVIRVTNAVNLAGAGAIVFFADQRVRQ